MKLFVFAAITVCALSIMARADNDAAPSPTPSTALVTNNHGGYNVTQPGAHAAALPFFGSHGYAAHVIAESHTEKPKFILVPVVEDVGHGNKVTVYKKVYFATAEEAEAAKAKQ